MATFKGPFGLTPRTAAEITAILGTASDFEGRLFFHSEDPVYEIWASNGDGTYEVISGSGAATVEVSLAGGIDGDGSLSNPLKIIGSRFADNSDPAIDQHVVIVGSASEDPEKCPIGYLFESTLSGDVTCDSKGVTTVNSIQGLNIWGLNPLVVSPRSTYLGFFEVSPSVWEIQPIGFSGDVIWDATTNNLKVQGLNNSVALLFDNTTKNQVLIQDNDGNVDVVPTLGVSNGGTGVATLTGYVKGNGTSAFSASATIPRADITGLGAMADVASVALTGDVTGSGTSSISTTIANDAVTFAKMQNVATNTLLGRSSAGTGDIQTITCSSFARSLLDDTDAITARSTLGLGSLATKNNVLSTDLALTTTLVTGSSYSVASGTFTSTGVVMNPLPAGSYLLFVDMDVAIGITSGPDAEIQCEIWNATNSTSIIQKTMNKGFSTFAVAGRHAFTVVFTILEASNIQLRARRLSSGSPTWSFSNLSGIAMNAIRIG